MRTQTRVPLHLHRAGIIPLKIIYYAFVIDVQYMCIVYTSLMSLLPSLVDGCKKNVITFHYIFEFIAY